MNLFIHFKTVREILQIPNKTHRNVTYTVFGVEKNHSHVMVVHVSVFAVMFYRSKSSVQVSH